ncbi:hypothetical protein [Marinicella sp. W31]|uniref:hypothetical protein n=1 Tax=Marinicella sp. W31 TaxID=3023713 RepID=UPI0037584B9B
MKLFYFYVLIIGCSLLPEISYGQAFKTKTLMERESFKADGATSNMLRLMFFVEGGHNIKAGNFIFTENQGKIPHARAQALASGELWVDYIKPNCDYLKTNYEPGYVDDKKALKERRGSVEQQYPLSQSVNTFMAEMYVGIFSLCDEYDSQIDHFNNHHSGGKKLIETSLYNYNEMLEEAKDASDLGLSKYVSIQTAEKYNKRKSLKSNIQITLEWLNRTHTDTLSLQKWNQQFSQLNDAWNTLMFDNRQRVAAKSELPKDVFKFGDDPYRQIISDLVKNQWAITPERIILREAAERNHQRVRLKDGKMYGVRVSVLPFVSVIQQNKDELSTHVGWLERVQKEAAAVDPYWFSKSATSIFLKQDKAKANFQIFWQRDEDNFSSPRVDQIVLSPNGTVPEKSAAVSVDTILPESPPKQKSVASSDTKKSQVVIVQNESTLTARMVSGAMGFVMAIFLLFAGILSAAPFLASNVPEKIKATFENLINNLSKFKNVISLGVIGIGLLGLFYSLITLSLMGIISALVGIGVGLVIADSSLLTHLGSVKNLNKKLHGISTPLGLVAMVMGLLNIVTSL